ncbi:MAG TPA: VacJ family lipoprotein [Burkholderiales bacterium]
MRRWLAAGFAVLAAGCASANVNVDPRDPWEGMNRGIYRFNEKLDDWIARPVATAYRDVVHAEIRLRVRNFFSNLADPFIGVNNMLQGKFEDGISDWARFAFNSTIGLLGLHDVASDMGYDKHNEDFGQTFGRWGVGFGPYLVLPALGPSSVRDGTGTAVDWVTDPLNLVDSNTVHYSLVGVRVTQQRADLLDAGRLLEEAALDRYVFLRDAYFQRRRSLIYDGRPPREEVNDSLDSTVK